MRKAGAGQAIVEYLLMSLALLVVFTSLYGFLQGSLKKYFQAAGKAILSVYK